MDSLDPLRPIPFGYSPTWSERDKYNVKAPIESADEIRLALIGLGGVAVGRHLPAIRRLRDTGLRIRVVAGADPDAGVREKIAEINEFPCYADAGELLAKEMVHGALVLTDPGESRFNVMRQVIQKGVHLFAEKPLLFFGVDRLGETIAKAHKLMQQAAAAKLVTMTGFVKQFSAPYQRAKSLIESGAIGEPSMFAIKMCQGWSRHILLEGQACHVLHIARWLGGDIKGLQAFGINKYGEPNYPHDNITVNVEFESGAIGAFYFNSSSPSLKPWERVEVFGNRKWLAVEDGYSVTLHGSEEGPSQVWSPVIPHTLFLDEEFGGFTGEVRSFVEAIRRGVPAPVTGEDGVAALVLAQMIHTSVRERRYVARRDIPLEIS